MQQSTIIIAVSVLLGLVLLGLEWRRPVKAHLVLRLLAVITATTALACLLLPVRYNKTRQQNTAHEAILLTQGFNGDSLSAYPGLPVYTLDYPIKQNIPRANFVSDAGLLSGHQPPISLLHVLGTGLTSYQLEQLSGIPIQFTPPVRPGGVTSVNFTARVNAGSWFRTQGQYNNNTEKPVKLKLLELSTIQDSATIPPHQATLFNLSAKPKHTGKALYQLLGVSGTDTLSHDPLPAVIQPVHPVKILLLSAAPDFENKFLKNWLTSNGYPVAVRSAVSKGKTSTTLVNTGEISLNHLTANGLSRFDAVTADAAALNALDPAESAALRRQVEVNGLGLIIRADSSKAGAGWWQSGLKVINLPYTNPVKSKLIIADEPQPTSLLPVSPNTINALNTQVIVADAQQHAFAVSRLTGEGHVVYTTLTQTYPWALAGNQRDYTMIWAALINRSARRLPQSVQWSVNAALPTVGEMTTLQLQASFTVPLAQINKAVTAGQQQPEFPFINQLPYWPEQPGWQQAGISNSNFNWYAYQQNHWQTLRTQQNIAATMNYTEDSAKRTYVTKIIQQIIRIEVPKFYFYVLLLLACTYLWAESRWLS